MTVTITKQDSDLHLKNSQVRLCVRHIVTSLACEAQQIKNVLNGLVTNFLE